MLCKLGLYSKYETLFDHWFLAMFVSNDYNTCIVNKTNYLVLVLYC